MQSRYLKDVIHRRSRYAIENKLPLSQEEFLLLVENALKYCPSANNSQSGRIVVLLQEHHNKFWETLKTLLQEMIKPEKFPKTALKIDEFNAGYGTILFFEDQETVTGLQTKYPKYAHNYPDWSMQSSGILQYIIWTALSSVNIGASLQHYTEIINEYVTLQYNIPRNWKLISQMPFGGIVAEPEEKTFLPLSERMRIYPE